jgi:hypothetical protein
MRTMSRETGHARLIAQIYAEAALSPTLAEVVRRQLHALRTAIAQLIPDSHPGDSAQIAEAFVSVCIGYSEQLAVRGDLDPAPFSEALMAILEHGTS